MVVVSALARVSVPMVARVVDAYAAVRLVVDALVTVSFCVVDAKVKNAEPVNAPLLLNCICVSAPPTVKPLPPWSEAQTTRPRASVVSLPPLPYEEQLVVESWRPLSMIAPETRRWRWR